jgi:hypothetical protein
MDRRDDAKGKSTNTGGTKRRRRVRSVTAGETAGMLLVLLTAQRRQSWVRELVVAPLLWVWVAAATLKSRTLIRQLRASA